MQIPAVNMQTCALVKKFKKWISVKKNSKWYMEYIKTNFQRANVDGSRVMCSLAGASLRSNM